MYFYYINNRKETFENLDSFIKSTNNGQWTFHHIILIKI